MNQMGFRAGRIAVGPASVKIDSGWRMLDKEG